MLPGGEKGRGAPSHPTGPARHRGLPHPHSPPPPRPEPPSSPYSARPPGAKPCRPSTTSRSPPSPPPPPPPPHITRGGAAAASRRRRHTPTVPAAPARTRLPPPQGGGHLRWGQGTACLHPRWRRNGAAVWGFFGVFFSFFPSLLKIWVTLFRVFQRTVKKSGRDKARPPHHRFRRPQRGGGAGANGGAERQIPGGRGGGAPAHWALWRRRRLERACALVAVAVAGSAALR